MELAASCMETELISAKNIFNLILKNEGKNWKLKKEYFEKKKDTKKSDL
jgi:hypothetical protein